MTATWHQVNLSYSREELQKLFAAANEADVTEGGRYDARGAAIIVWSHHWGNLATQIDSDILGIFYVRWADENRIWQIETHEGFDRDDLLHELAELETKALGHIKHGRYHTEPQP